MTTKLGFKNSSLNLEMMTSIYRQNLTLRRRAASPAQYDDSVDSHRQLHNGLDFWNFEVNYLTSQSRILVSSGCTTAQRPLIDGSVPNLVQNVSMMLAQFASALWLCRRLNVTAQSQFLPDCLFLYVYAWFLEISAVESDHEDETLSKTIMKDLGFTMWNPFIKYLR